MSNREKSKGLRNFLLALSMIPLQVSGHCPIAAILHPHPCYFSQLCPQFTPRTMLHVTTQQTPSTGIRARSHVEVADKIKLSLVLPHQAIFTSADMDQVDISAATNDMGTLANHVSSIEPPRPGVVEVIECRNASENSVVPGCSATVHPNNKLTINAVLPASPSTSLPLLSPSEQMSYIMFELSPHQEPIAILSRNMGACHLTVTPTTVTTEFASMLHLCCYYHSPQQVHNQHGRGCSPGVSSANQIGPVDKSFNNAPTPSVCSQGGLGHIQVVPLLGLEQIKVHQVFAILSSTPPVLHCGYYHHHHLHGASFVLRSLPTFSVEAIRTNLTKVQKIVVGDCRGMKDWHYNTSPPPNRLPYPVLRDKST